MSSADYPALRSDAIHLDAASYFPVHQKVIDRMTEYMARTLGSSGKASYGASEQARDEIEATRRKTAHFLGAHEDEIFFCYSASDALSRLFHADTRSFSALAYSPEDHTGVTKRCREEGLHFVPIQYTIEGTYDMNNVTLPNTTLMVASLVHHLYGSVNAVGDWGAAAIYCDISQAVGRLTFSLNDMPVDAAFFSGQKIGALAGVGVLYVCRDVQQHFDLIRLQPRTAPAPSIASLDAALDVLSEQSAGDRYSCLADQTSRAIARLCENPSVRFTKGAAQATTVCMGLGVVSFFIDGYEASDVAMILDDANIHVRAGGHCISDDHDAHAAIRMSWGAYLSDADLDRALEIIAEL